MHIVNVEIFTFMLQETRGFYFVISHDAQPQWHNFAQGVRYSVIGGKC